MVLYGMKITITMSEEVYGKLERDRGMVPRATYIQGLIMGDVEPSGGVFQDAMGFSVVPEVVGPGVEEDVVTDVMTDVPTKEWKGSMFKDKKLN
jgi:hypothetical protein